MSKEILNIDDYLNKLTDEYLKKIDGLKEKLDDTIKNIATQKSASEIINLINSSELLDSNLKQKLKKNYRNKELSMYEWFLITREILLDENYPNEDILKETGFDEIIDFAEQGAMSLATKQLKDFSINFVEKKAASDPNSSIKFNGKEKIIEIPENLYSDFMEKFRQNLIEVTTDSIKTLTNQLLDVYTDSTIYQEEKILKQKNYNQPNFLEFFTEKTVTMPFRKEYSKELLQTSISQGVIVSPKFGTNYLNIIKLNALIQNLDELDLEIIEAYYTEKSVNPEAGGITFLDLANDIYRSKTGKKLKSRDKFVQEIRQRAWRLTDLPFYLDFNPQINFILENYKDSEIKSNFQRYRDNGGSGVIRTHFIQGESVQIKKSNGMILDGLTFGKSSADNLFFEYIEMTRGLKRIPELLLLNPLKAMKDNVILHNYLAGKLMQLPYHSSQKKLMSIKLNLLNLNEFNSDLKDLQIYKDALEFQKSLSKKDLTIRVDTLKTDLKLNTRNTRLISKLDTFFDDWKNEGYINRYVKNYTSNNRSVESYTIYIF